MKTSIAVRRILMLALLFWAVAAACKKDDNANPTVPATPDPRAHDLGNYHFMIRTVTSTQASGWTFAEDTVYYNGTIVADPNSTDSIIVRYDSIPAHYITTLVDSTDDFWFTDISGQSHGVLNESGAIVFSKLMQFDTSTHMWHYVSGQRY